MVRFAARPPGFSLKISDLLRVALLASPVLVLLLLLRDPRLDPQVEVPVFHFAIVTLTAGVGFVLGVLVLRGAERLEDARAFFLGLAFCTVAGFFFIHGFLTPGVIVRQASRGIGWAPHAGFLLGAFFLALSTARPRPGGETWAFRQRYAIVLAVAAAWAAFFTLSVTVPEFLPGHASSFRPYVAAPTVETTERIDDEYGVSAPPMTSFGPAPGQRAPSTRLAGSLVLVSSALLMFAAGRYARNYRLSRLPLHATVVAGIVLLVESLLSFVLASLWRISWWEYHVLVLLGMSTILFGVVADYGRGMSLTQTISKVLLSTSIDTLERTYSEVLTALIAAVEARDPYTKGHSEKVARLAVQIGERLALSPDRLRLLYQAGLVHDIGKIAIPDAILNKAGRLTPAEFALVRGHPVRSEEMIRRIPSLRSTLGAVRWHHERLDGSGYPDGLEGDTIPLEARVLAVADVFDAMASGRAYRPAWPEEAVVAYLRQQAGTQFDSRTVEALERLLADRAVSRSARAEPIATPAALTP